MLLLRLNGFDRDAADLHHSKFDLGLSNLPPASIAADWFMKFSERKQALIGQKVMGRKSDGWGPRGIAFAKPLNLALRVSLQKLVATATTSRARELLHGARGMAANNKYLAESNKIEGRCPATKSPSGKFGFIARHLRQVA